MTHHCNELRQHTTPARREPLPGTSSTFKEDT